MNVFDDSSIMFFFSLPNQTNQQCKLNDTLFVIRFRTVTVCDCCQLQLNIIFISELVIEWTIYLCFNRSRVVFLCECLLHNALQNNRIYAQRCNNVNRLYKLLTQEKTFCKKQIYYITVQEMRYLPNRIRVHHKRKKKKRKKKYLF